MPVLFRYLFKYKFVTILLVINFNSNIHLFSKDSELKNRLFLGINIEGIIGEELPLGFEYTYHDKIGGYSFTGEREACIGQAGYAYGGNLIYYLSPHFSITSGIIRNTQNITGGEDQDGSFIRNAIFTGIEYTVGSHLDKPKYHPYLGLGINYHFNQKLTRYSPEDSINSMAEFADHFGGHGCIGLRAFNAKRSIMADLRVSYAIAKCEFEAITENGVTSSVSPIEEWNLLKGEIYSISLTLAFKIF